MKKFWAFLLQKRFLFWLYFLIGILIAVQLLIEQQTINPTSFNNYRIFKNSFGFLINHENLYSAHPSFYFDLFKYTPSFSVLMIPFYYAPNWLGLCVWNVLNTMVLCVAIYSITKISEKKRAFILLFTLLEMITSLQNSQSNILIAGLLIFAFSFFEKEKIIWASLFIVLTFFIKIFGIAAAVMFLFYPKKGKFILYSIGWSALLLILPLIFISAKDLIWQYQNWFAMLKNDQQISYGVSVLGLAHSWLHVDLPKTITEISGLIILIFPAIKIIRENNFEHRVNFFCAILLWMILFNHRSESPTFIIATTSVAFWYAAKNEFSKINLALVVLVFVFTILITTDIIPLPNKGEWLFNKALKALPVFLVWLKIVFDFYFPVHKKSISPKPFLTN